MRVVSAFNTVPSGVLFGVFESKAALAYRFERFREQE
jgi:hypothetical protein